MNYCVPDDTQLWYLDDQPDGTFLIASKIFKRVLECSVADGKIGKIVVQHRRGDNSQKWLLENEEIVSLEHKLVLCAKDLEISPVCVKKKVDSGIHACCLQTSVSGTVVQYSGTGGTL